MESELLGTLTCRPRLKKQDGVSDETTITEAIFNMRLDTIKIPPCSKCLQRREFEQILQSFTGNGDSTKLIYRIIPNMHKRFLH